MSVCTKITKIGEVSGTDVLSVTIDNDITALWFYNNAEAMRYVGQEVIVEYRKDIWQGEVRDFISTFIIPNTVTTLTREDNIKLFCDVEDNNSNITFSDIADGETAGGCIVFCIKQEFKSSTKATWVEYLIRDKSMHVATLRLFDYTNVNNDMSGMYIVTELSRSKYGFQTDIVEQMRGDCPPNPELDIAINYIKGYFSTDVEAMSFINKHNLFGYLAENIDYEKGYGVVRLAMELSLVDSMKNITNELNLTAMSQALLAKRGYLTLPNSVLSNVFKNMHLANNTIWSERKAVMQLLDVNLDEHIKEYYVMTNIEETVDTILKVRKGFE